MSPASHQRSQREVSYGSEPERLIAEKGPISRDGADTLSALIRGIDDLDRLRDWQEAAAERGRRDVQRRLTERREELLDEDDGRTAQGGASP